MKILTKGDLHKISKRIDELDLIIDLCDPDHDDDVLANADAELGELVAILESSYSKARIKESGFYIVKSEAV
jgi:hypothetical protein